MPRRARLSIAGIPWHIIQRGNNRTACFYTEKDYRRYLSTLEELAERHGCRVHAYVLMTNHVHLLITPQGKDSAALLMKHLVSATCSILTAAINAAARYGRAGFGPVSRRALIMCWPAIVISS